MTASLGSSVKLAIPVEVSGLPDGARVILDELTFTISTETGEIWEMRSGVGRAPSASVDVVARLVAQSGSSAWQMIYLDRSIYDLIGDRKVTLEGRVSATLYRDGPATRTPLGTGTVAVPGAGRCSDYLMEASMRLEMVKVLCESPEDLPLITQVQLSLPGSDRIWTQRLGDSMPYISYPLVSWLSPLNRRQTFFQITYQNTTLPGARWLVPRDLLDNAELTIQPNHQTGCVVLRYRLPDLNIRDFLSR